MSTPLTRAEAEGVIYADDHAADKAIASLREQISYLEDQLQEALHERRDWRRALDRISDGEATLDQLAEWVEDITGDAVEVVEDPTECPCPACQGDGEVGLGDRCAYCGGSGRVSTLA